MNIEEVKAQEKGCCDCWKDLIGHEEEGMGSTCVNV